MLDVANLSKTFAGGEGSAVRATDAVSFSVRDGDLFTLLGPSGCGKTTTLRCIAGLERAESGEIRIADQPVFSSDRRLDVPVHARDIGMVFQSYAIWPHMSVFDNVAFPLRVSPGRPSRKDIERRVMAGLERVQLGEYARRDSTKLSGGQQQRLALARALVREPKMLLLDEPLSNLDAKLREQMRFELKKLQRDLGITCLYVTHDQFEALALSDQIAVMCNGRVEQIGTPREIYERPANQFVANFIGTANFLRGRVVRRPGPEGEDYIIETRIGEVHCLAGRVDANIDNVVVAIRPEHVLVGSGRPQDGENVFTAEIVNWVYLGESNDIEARIGDVPLRIKGGTEQDPSLMARLRVCLPSHHCVVLPETAGDGSHTGGDGRGSGRVTSFSNSAEEPAGLESRTTA